MAPVWAVLQHNQVQTFAMDLYISSTAIVISPSEAKSVKKLFFGHTTLAPGRASVLQPLMPESFWINSVDIQEGAVEELLQWLDNQTRLNLLCIERMSQSFINRTMGRVIYPFSANSLACRVRILKLENQGLSPTNLACVSKFTEFSPALKILSIKKVKLGQYKSFLPKLWMTAGHLKRLLIYNQVLSVRAAFSVAYAMREAALNKNRRTENLTLPINNFLVLRAFAAEMEKSDSLRTTVDGFRRNIGREKRSFLKRILMNKLDLRC